MYGRSERQAARERDARWFRRYALEHARQSGLGHRDLKRYAAQLRAGSAHHQALAARRILRAGVPTIRAGTTVHHGSGPQIGGLPLATVLTHGFHPVAGMGLNDVARVSVVPIARDAYQIAANTPASVYNVAAGGYEALHGDTRRLKQLGHAFVNTDPLALLVQGRWDEAAHAAAAHPLSTALELSGGKAAVGGSLGRVQRLAGAERFRAPAVLEGTRIRLPRPYSRDAITRARQHATDRVRTRRAARFEREADQAEQAGALDRARDLRRKARDTSPEHVTDAEIRRRVDERADANEHLRRSYRAQAVNEARKRRVPERKGGHVVPLIAQNIVRADRQDLVAYIRELEAERASGRLSRSQERANRQTVDRLRAVVDNPRTDYAKLEAAARGYAETSLPVEQQLVAARLLEGSQAEKARLIPYAVRRMGARHDGDRIVDARGNPLTTAQIRAHMDRFYGGKAPEPVFMAQSPNARGARNYYMNTLQRQTVGGAARTGEATRKGTFDTHPDTLLEQAARQRGLLAADHGFKGFVDEFAVRNPDDGKVLTFGDRRSAADMAREIDAQGGRPVRPIRVNPFLGRKRELEALLEDVNAGDDVHGGVVDALQAAVKGHDGEGPWVLVHDAAASRLSQYLNMQGPQVALRGVQRVNQAFRNAVLPLSTKWITGNVVEAGFRTALAKAGPLSYLTGRRILKRMDELAGAQGFTGAQALEAQLRTAGGGHFSMAERQSVHRSAEQFEQSALRPLARALGAAARAPGPKQLGALWRTYTHAVFRSNTVLEKQFQVALAGRYARDFMFDRSQVRTMGNAVEQAARGLRNTNEQVAMGRFIDRAYGKYGKLSPAERALVAYYTPFIAWSLNAVKFVTSVLPKDHPIALGVSAAAQNASQDWLKDKRLVAWMDGAAPGWLQGSVPTGKGFIRAGRYLPYGFFADPADSVTSVLLPQYIGAAQALRGLDWKGDPLNGKFGGEASQSEMFGAAFRQFFEATVPIAGQVEQVASKKGPIGLRLRRQFNPFEPVENTNQATARKGGGGYWDSGGSSGGGYWDDEKPKTGSASGWWK